MKNRIGTNVFWLAALLALTACGGGGGGGSGGLDPNPTVDTTPDTFSFVHVSDAEPGSVRSASVTITGINAAVPVTVTGGSYSIDDGEQTTSSGTVKNEQRVTLFLESADEFETEATATLTVGGVSADFRVTTLADTQLPTVEVHFPFVEFYTDATIIRVRGVAADNDQVSSVEVNGVLAESSDKFAHWVAEVPRAGASEIVVVARDPKENEAQKVLSLRAPSGSFGSGETIGEIKGMHVDAENRRLLFVNNEGLVLPKHVFALDMNTLARTRLNTSDFAFAGPSQLVFTPQQNSILVADGNSRAVLSLDGNGDSATFSAGENASVPARGEGPDMRSPSYLARDNVTGRVWLSDTVGESILELDVTGMSGDRTVVTGPTAAGDPMGLPTVLTFDTLRQRLITLDTASPIAGAGGDVLLAVDLASGTRTAISHNLRGEGDPLTITNSSGLIFDEEADRLLVVSDTRSAILAVNPDSGDRSTFSNATTGRGPVFTGQPRVAALDPVSRTLFVGMDSDVPDRNVIFAIDLENGDRVMITPLP